MLTHPFLVVTNRVNFGNFNTKILIRIVCKYVYLSSTNQTQRNATNCEFEFGIPGILYTCILLYCHYITNIRNCDRTAKIISIRYWVGTIQNIYLPKQHKLINIMVFISKNVHCLFEYIKLQIVFLV